MTKFSDSSAPFIDAEVAKLLALDTIREVPFSEENFYSRLFLVPKKEGSYCPVIDLSRLNHFLENYHFQMENISCLKSLINHDDFMTSVDLKDAYLSVHIHRSSQKYLCFQWRNKSFAFQGLPFGLNTAHRVFTKLLKPVAAYLPKRDIRIIVYLDDFLILGSSKEESILNTRLTLEILQWLGLIINWDKSTLVPTQSLTFLGFTINSLTMSPSLPEGKILKVRQTCQKALASPTVSSGSCRPPWHPGVYSSSHLAGPSPLSLLANSADQDIACFTEKLQHNSVPEQQCPSRTPVVDYQCRERKQQPHQPSCPRSVHNIRRFKRQVGGPIVRLQAQTAAGRHTNPKST